MNTGKTKYPPAEYFLEWTFLSAVNCWRWIEYKGWEVERFMGQEKVLSALGSTDVLTNPLCFGHDQKRCMFTKDRLNSEYVKKNEPENWSLPTWQEIYAKTHEKKTDKDGF